MHVRQRHQKLIGFVLVVFTLAAATHALMIKIPLKRLASESDAIFIGRVQSVRCEWSLDKRLILSIVTVRVQETLKGHRIVPDIILEVPGGTLGDLSLKVTNMPTFHEKEEVLVFLRSITNVAEASHSFTVAQNYIPSYEVFGKAQGKYAIDADGMVRKSGYETLTEEENPETLLSLESLKSQIRSTLKETPSKRQRNR